MSKILEALAKLDVGNDNHWTEEGLPRMDTMKLMVGDQALTREAVTAAAPSFSRTSPLTATAPADAAVVPPVTPTAAAVTPPAVVEKSNAGLEGSAGARAAHSEEDESYSEAEFASFLEGARAQVERASARKKEADQDHAKAVEVVDQILDAIAKAGYGKEDLSTQIGSYLQAQKAVGQERAERIEALKGFDLKTLMPKTAPLDAAMARKNLRGMQRPGSPK